ncbi:MAG: hypothetical protein WC655_27660, partial [Candidatus Hydrogenedentales bacterium]
MALVLNSPRQALSRAFLRQRVSRTEIDLFKANLIRLLDSAVDSKSEEFHKKLVSDFLEATYYRPNYFLNVKGNADLVIHNG